MRTRSSGAASPLSSSPGPAQESRGKKRRSRSHDYGPADLPTPPTSEAAAPTSGKSDGLDADETLALTPRKNKRVRFSEPMEAFQCGVESSTGLTPFMRKTKLARNTRGGSRHPANHRRVTLPARLEHDSPMSPVIERIQFAPLRQVLDKRLRRRLRRAHLSEEGNEIQIETRDRERAQRELAQLRAQGQQSDEKIKELMYELESQRQLSIRLGNEEEVHAQALHEELERLRQELGDRDAAEEERRRIEGSPTEVDEDENLWDDVIDPASPLANNFNVSSSSPLTRGAHPSSPLPPSSPPLEIAVHTPYEDEFIGDQSPDVTEPTHQLTDALAALKWLHNELLALGFKGGEATSEEVIDSIKDNFRETRLELEYLLPGETAGGFENVLLLPAMLKHIRNLLVKLKESRQTLDSQDQSESALRGQFNGTLEKIAHLENEKTVLIAQIQAASAEGQRKDQLIHDLQLASDARAGLVSERDGIIDNLESELEPLKQQLGCKTEEVNQLTATVRDQAISVERLQTALQSYRTEVVSLEKLVSGLEQEKQQSQAYALKVDDSAIDKERRLQTNLSEIAQFIQSHLQQMKANTQEHLEQQTKACEEAQEFLNIKLSTASTHVRRRTAN